MQPPSLTDIPAALEICLDVFAAEQQPGKKPVESPEGVKDKEYVNAGLEDAADEEQAPVEEDDRELDARGCGEPED